LREERPFKKRNPKVGYHSMKAVNQIFCTREIFNAVPLIQASMKKNAMEDLTSCLHYSDDLELMGDGIWSDTWEIDQSIKYFVLEKSLMPYHQSKHQ
jgi:hypothetical protein